MRLLCLNLTIQGDQRCWLMDWGPYVRSKKFFETTKNKSKKTENMKTRSCQKGFVKGRCSICKEEGHNAKGHYNVLKRVVGTSSNQSP
ncbi:hypothetical protein H5410_047489 [Solanum commersonii]|uniref:Uncharacterized protein n=1 Tax=Solanum commersonii TaxID=4109 RepID=A0A9J5XHG2_SOLCO|nr:hypothetical protein H5410_047489 [Solanum commersonii]